LQPEKSDLLDELLNTATKREGTLMNQDDEERAKERSFQLALIDMLLHQQEVQRRFAAREARLNMLRTKFLSNDDKASTRLQDVRKKALDVFARRVADPQINKDVLLRIAEFLIALRYEADYIALQQFPTEIPGQEHIRSRAESYPNFDRKVCELVEAMEHVRAFMPEYIEKYPERFAVSPAGDGSSEPRSPHGSNRPSGG
jgi:hypothetical protein